MITALTTIQNELVVPKGRYNRFGEFYYRSCDDILKALKPLLLKYGLQMTISDRLVLLGDRLFVEAVVSITNGETTLLASGFAEHSKSEPKMKLAQISGSTSSFARKYALCAMFLIDDEKDFDSVPQKEQGASAPPVPAPAPTQVKSGVTARALPPPPPVVKK